jgi:hypothetical protein
MSDISVDNKLSNYIIQTINKSIEDTKNLTELSQLLQIDNISKSKVLHLKFCLNHSMSNYKATPTSSGLTDFYYPSLGFHDLIETSKIKRVPIPNELVEQYRSKFFFISFLNIKY